MGVPKFFRWLSERYPCLCEELKEYQIPEFDNLYLDMNGIIHFCSHPNDFDPHFRISNEKIFTDIFHYIEVLFRLIRPKKLFFMAVDGVAPRAKMNQQRGRRFSSAKEAETLEKKALEMGESLPTDKRFDSNCITPGTKFMADLQEQLKYFIANKISNDKLWQKPTVILSGHSVPGEGEHKIMEYIRFLRSKPDWDPHTRHCLYGLDADLIILGLCTHEPNFTLLREEVKFVKQSKRISTPETTNYVLFQLSLLRGYLDLEFNSLKTTLPFPYDIEKIIDDWVLLGFLVGNDFIPHLPHLHIHCNALGILYDAYKAILPKLDGYINENGVLNLVRLENFLTQLSQFDVDNFSETYTDMKYFESKTGRKMFPEVQIEDESGKVKFDESALQALISSTALEMFDFEDDDANNELHKALEPEGLETINTEEEEGENGRLFFREFSEHKRHYYMEKMKYPSVSSEVLKREAEGYVTALQWILFYYYRGCPSWSWYYPHHYSPYVSDVKGFSSLDIEFNLGKPFLPFQQLLAVLPSASKELLPKCYEGLMTSEDSPIIDYYPKEFKFDLNGKRQEWEAVVLIPFIDETRLLEAMEPMNVELNNDEIQRNSHGPMHVYTYTSKSLGPYSAPKYFPEVKSNHAMCIELYPRDIAVPPDELIVGHHPALSSTDPLYVPGFPVLSSLSIQGNLEKRGVKVFQSPSRNESMILRLTDMKSQSDSSFESLANEILSCQHIYVSYPHLTLASAVVVMKEDLVAVKDSCDEVEIRAPKESEKSEFISKMRNLREHHITRLGIDMEGSNMLVYAYPLEGTYLSFGYDNKAVYKKIWSKTLVCYLFDLCLPRVNTLEDRSMDKQLYLEDIYHVGVKAFMTAVVSYGSQITVKEVCGRHLVVDVIKTSEPSMARVEEAIQSCSIHYYTGYECAAMLGISSHLLSRITSAILVQSLHTTSDRTNIGLSLKNARSNQQMIGYTKKEGTQWLYSGRVVDLVYQYMTKFPKLFEYLACNIKEDIFFKDRMFPPDKEGESLAEIRAWLKTLDKGEMRAIESELLEPSVVQVLEDVLTSYQEEDLVLTTMKLKSNNFYMPKPDLSTASPDPMAEHRLLDRIVYVRECHSIPVGAKGIIIGIEKKRDASKVTLEGREKGLEWDEAATLYDVIFDREVIGGQNLYGIKKKLIYRLNQQVFLNISYGQRSTHQPSKPRQQSYSKRNPKYPRNRNSISQTTDEGGSGTSKKDMNSLLVDWRREDRHPATENPPVNLKNADASGSIKPTVPSSLNVHQLLGYYSNKNNVATSSVNKHVGIETQQSQQRGDVIKAIQSKPSDSVPTTPDQMADMWNMLKGLQVQCRVSGDGQSDRESHTSSMPGVKQDVILSQTFTRTHGLQRHDTYGTSCLQQPSANHPEPPRNALEQTEALKKLLCIDGNSKDTKDENKRKKVRSVVDGSSLPGLKPTGLCGHHPDCQVYFQLLCNYLGLEKPLFKYKLVMQPNGFRFVKGTCYFKWAPPHLSHVDGPACPCYIEATHKLACFSAQYLIMASRSLRPEKFEKLVSEFIEHELQYNPSWKGYEANSLPYNQAPVKSSNNKPKQAETSRIGSNTAPMTSMPVETSQPSSITTEEKDKQNNKRHRRRKMRPAANFQNPLQ